jgi:hypothetical protein
VLRSIKLFSILLPLDFVVPGLASSNIWRPSFVLRQSIPAMAPKRASSKVAASIDDVAKAALLAEKKGKALADNTLQEAFKDDAVNSKRQCQDNHPTPDSTVRTCSFEGAPRAPPPGFAPPEGEDTVEDSEIIGISTEDQLKLRALASRTITFKRKRNTRSQTLARHHASQSATDDTG